MSQSSSYSPSEKNENERLKIQANLSRAIDVRLFQAALKDLPDRPLALDIGCAQGYVTFDRFTTLGDFGPVIGIDTDGKAIGTAIEQIPKDWSFESACKPVCRSYLFSWSKSRKATPLFVSLANREESRGALQYKS